MIRYFKPAFIGSTAVFDALLGVALLLSSSLSGAIFEAPCFSDILKEADKKTLVLLDIDDTLMIPVQSLGSDVWFRYRKEELEKGGITSKEALEKALSEWEAIRHLTKMKLVEPGIDQVVAKMQKEGFLIMGLTTQGLALATRTVQQLISLGIDLSLTAPSSENHYFQNNHGVLYRQGILFTSGTHKGKAILKFLREVELSPKKIVFINDKQTHLQEVEGEVEKAGISFVGLRYSASDERVNAFDPAIAEIQFAPFKKLLSDEEAEAVLYDKEAS